MELKNTNSGDRIVNRLNAIPTNYDTHYDPSLNMDNRLIVQPRDKQEHYHDTHMYSLSYPMNFNNDRSSSSSSQAIDNIFVPTKISIQLSDIQNSGVNASPGELHTDAIYSYASSGDVRNSQPQKALLKDPEFLSILNEIQVPPSNRNVDDEQPPPPY